MISKSENKMGDDPEIELERTSVMQKTFLRREYTVKCILILCSFTIIMGLAIFSIQHQTFSKRGYPLRYTTEKEAFDETPKHEAFLQVRTKYLETQQATMHLYRHRKTHAEFMAFMPKDTKLDKTFGINFRTKPTSNNGVVHILEHAVLMSSKAYPVKNLFGILAKASLSTYLNAFTYNDRTVYPVASRNRKDFKNLMNVYLDVVFAPKCVEEDGHWILRQEGWRYDTDENTGELEVKGVVYNEMKGVFSNPLSILSRETYRMLFPDNTYHYDSGGEPTDIPTLTQDELNTFYKENYHPTNSKIFVSGDITDVQDAMTLVDSYLKRYDHNATVAKKTMIQFQKKTFVHHLHQSIPYAVQKIKEEEGQHMLCITWLINDDHLTPEVELAVQVLNYLLVGKKSSPLQRRLTESGLGSLVIGGGLSTELLQSTFAIGMKGVKKKEVMTLEILIFEILQDVVNDGFEDDDVEASMNSVEFYLREVHTGSDPAGISVLLRMLRKWNYEQAPESMLDYSTALSKLKEMISEQGSKLFTELVQDLLVNNNHRVHMELTPSTTIEDDIIEKERERLRETQSTMTASQLQTIKDQTQQLYDIQSKDNPPDILNLIPTIGLQDIDRSGVEYDIDVVKNAYGSNATLTKNSVDGSGGIVYVDVGIDISSVSYANVEILPFIATMLSESDTNTKSRVEIDRLIGMHTGGLQIELKLIPIYNYKEHIAMNNRKMRTMLFFRGKCVAEKTQIILDLIKDIVENSEIESQEKTIQILDRKISMYENSVPSDERNYAVKRIHARYDIQSFLDEKLNGISQLHALRNTMSEVKDSWDEFKVRMTNTMQSFSTMHAHSTLINLTSDQKSLNEIDGIVQGFISSLRVDCGNQTLMDFESDDHPWVQNGEEEMATLTPIRNEGIVIPSQVSYVGLGGNLFESNESVRGGSCVPLEHIGRGYLWNRVRLQNGAYGVRSRMDAKDGFLYMVSFRDPELTKTIHAFEETGNFLSEEIDDGAINTKTITAAIIGCIGSIEGAALPPRSVGWVALNRYITGPAGIERRQRWRDDILSAGIEDFINFAMRLNTMWRNTTMAALAPISALNEAKSTLNFVEILL